MSFYRTSCVVRFLGLRRGRIMSATYRFVSQVSEGLIFGFTFAFGWLAAMLVFGALLA
jgi:hypothetical protein